MASLIKWEPLSDLVSLRDAMDRLFEESFVRMRGLPSIFGAETLAVDLYETPESVVVKTSVPGVKPAGTVTTRPIRPCVEIQSM